MSKNKKLDKYFKICNRGIPDTLRITVYGHCLIAMGYNTKKRYSYEKRDFAVTVIAKNVSNGAFLGKFLTHFFISMPHFNELCLKTMQRFGFLHEKPLKTSKKQQFLPKTAKNKLIYTNKPL